MVDKLVYGTVVIFIWVSILVQDFFAVAVGKQLDQIKHTDVVNLRIPNDI